MFHVRSIYPGNDRIEEGTFQLQPSNPQADAICKLFTEYLKNRPPEFRDKLSFLKRGGFEMDWSSAPGGVALVSIFQGADPASMGVLVAGLDADTDAMMLEVFRENVLCPLFGDCYGEVLHATERPMLLQVIFAGPEWTATLQLLGASLASVYFRRILGIPD